MKKNKFRTLSNILFTPRCVLCKGDLVTGALCNYCTSMCTNYPPHAFNALKDEYGALFYYEFAVRDLIKSIKFFRGIIHAHALIKLMSQALDQSTIVESLRQFAPTAITYVPTAHLKRVMRGLDLPALFADMLAQRLEVPVVGLLKKQMSSPALSLASNRRERHRAVAGTLSLLEQKRTFERLVLVDDIFTTGATFDESRKVLKSISRECRCLAIARTP